MRNKKQTTGVLLITILFCCSIGACSSKVTKTVPAAATSSVGSGGHGGSSPDTTLDNQKVKMPPALSQPTKKVTKN